MSNSDERRMARVEEWVLGMVANELGPLLDEVKSKRGSERVMVTDVVRRCVDEGPTNSPAEVRVAIARLVHRKLLFGDPFWHRMQDDDRAELDLSYEGLFRARVISGEVQRAASVGRLSVTVDELAPMKLGDCYLECKDAELSRSWRNKAPIVPIVMLTEARREWVVTTMAFVVNRWFEQGWVSKKRKKGKLGVTERHVSDALKQLEAVLPGWKLTDEDGVRVLTLDERAPAVQFEDRNGVVAADDVEEALASEFELGGVNAMNRLTLKQLRKREAEAPAGPGVDAKTKRAIQDDRRHQL